MTLENRLETATSLCRSSQTSQLLLSRTQFCSTSDLAQSTGGHRPLLMIRRLALKSVMAAKKESVARCAGPLQCGVGRPDGANTMIKTI